MRALTRQGAIYSQGGALAGDPIDPATGQPYPRTGPDSFDCSGLVWWAYAQAGITIGQTTYQQLNNGVPIGCTLADLAGPSTRCWTLGDLIFLRYTGGQHVAIYVGRGLFMDCYNHATGCILHDVTTDSFYAAHFWQARRIVSGCEGLTNDPGQPLLPGAGDMPQLESIPALLAPVQLRIPWVCGSCTDDPGALQPTPVPDVSWFDLGSWFPWLLAQLWNTIALPIICWMIAIATAAAALAQLVVNAVLVAGVNGLWRLLWLMLLWAADTISSIWVQLDALRLVAWMAWLQFGQQLQLLLATIHELLDLIGALIEQLAVLIMAIAQALLYIAALFFTLVPALFSAISNPSTPQPLADIANYFLLIWLRETLQAIADSKLGWAWIAFIALFYARFALWLIDEAAELNS